jgi:hypothetical protein
LLPVVTSIGPNLFDTDMSNVPRQEAFALLRRLLNERIIRIV